MVKMVEHRLIFQASLLLIFLSSKCGSFNQSPKLSSRKFSLLMSADLDMYEFVGQLRAKARKEASAAGISTEPRIADPYDQLSGTMRSIEEQKKEQSLPEPVKIISVVPPRADAPLAKEDGAPFAAGFFPGGLLALPVAFFLLQKHLQLDAIQNEGFESQSSERGTEQEGTTTDEGEDTKTATEVVFKEAITVSDTNPDTTYKSVIFATPAPKREDAVVLRTLPIAAQPEHDIVKVRGSY